MNNPVPSVVPSARLVAAWRVQAATSGSTLTTFLAQRRRSMRAVNPSFVLRNCVAQAAIEVGRTHPAVFGAPLRLSHRRSL
jgi:uncharacterized protein YdiU (UPF0061 family)